MGEERGSLEKELYESLRRHGLSRTQFLARMEGRDLTADDLAKIAVQVEMAHMEAILRLAKEIDELRDAAG